MAEWITHAQVRKRFQDHFCESLYDHPELVTPDTVVEYEKMKDIMREEKGTALSLCNTTYRTNLHYAFLYVIKDKVYDNGKWYIAYITKDQRIDVPISASLIKEKYRCLEEKLKEH
jgi:CRISPR/Cas system-associated exonuclease Cas4 (RecB family)